MEILKLFHIDFLVEKQIVNPRFGDVGFGFGHLRN